MRLTWVQPEDLLPHELVQSAAEGKDVAAVRARWLAAGGDATPAVSGASAGPADERLRALASELLDELDAVPAPPDPTVDWVPPAAAHRPPLADLGRRLAGAWTGRAAGCLLGKPVEKIPRQGIEEILRASGRWPLGGYFTAAGLPADVAARWPWNRRSAPTSLAENIAGMPEDDDLNFPMLALDLLERHGRDFTTEDVAQLWLDHLPAGRVFTAERAAYRNLLEAWPVPSTATHRNPFREWIGALIRADVFGWVSPGRPDEAACLARTDARLSHTRDGVAGAMWAAALAASAVVADGVAEVLDTAAAAIPAGGHLADAVAFGRDAARRGGGLAAGLDRLHERYGHLHWVHVLNNAATIAFALEHGAGDFGRSVAPAVTAGWDTDSVGATVGGVVGALVGVEGIGARWTGPLDGRIATSLPGGERRIDDLVARTLALVPDEVAR
jgi:ADP-ribosylglycohydrolase